MPTTATILTSDGIKPTEYEGDSLRELAQQEPQGVYTITRTYQTVKSVLLEAHFDRLEESAQLEGINLQLDRAHLRTGLRQIIAKAGYRESRIRITIPKAHPEEPLLAAEPLAPIPAKYKSQGVAAATVAIERENPRAKSNAWEAIRSEARQELPAGVYEGLLVDDNKQILEGLSSNFYAIIDGALHTAERGILMGISRRILFEVKPEELELVPEPPTFDKLDRFAEAFISSSSRGIVPIVTINDHQVGGGRPGPITQRLCQRYDEWVLKNLEPI